jgi:anti-sigma regulatory factor (Ser/Thr protein kinase)
MGVKLAHEHARSRETSTTAPHPIDVLGALMSAEQAVLELAPDGTSPRRARVFIARTLREWDCADIEDVAALLVSEVVTNAVTHVRSPAVLSARYDGGRVEVRVEDRSDVLPKVRHTGPDDESGRGLMLVDALADHWGVESLAGGGKAVYFALDC